MYKLTSLKQIVASCGSRPPKLRNPGPSYQPPARPQTPQADLLVVVLLLLLSLLSLLLSSLLLLLLSLLLLLLVFVNVCVVVFCCRPRRCWLFGTPAFNLYASATPLEAVLDTLEHLFEPSRSIFELS